LIRFSFVEKYVVLFPVILGSLWVFTSLICPKCLWIVAVIAGYRLFDLGHGLFSIVVFEMQRDRKDEAGHYILVRHSVRWFLLFLVNLADITIAFSVLYNALGMYFTPPITSILSAMYQVSSTFTTVAGNQALPVTTVARILVLCQLIYMVFMFVLFLPIVVSVIRAKEVTKEVLGHNAGPDGRFDDTKQTEPSSAPDSE
jgi:hypothetical protein